MGFVPAYIHVRNHLYRMAQRALSGEGSIQIPSENELAKMFKVSRVTVRLAIKGLLNDRTLISKRGVGTFVNCDPASLKMTPLERSKVCGILVHQGGNAVEYPCAPLMAAMEKLNITPTHLYLPDSGKVESFLEQTRSLDALIYYMNVSGYEKMFPYLEAVQKSSLPLLVHTSWALPPGEMDCVQINASSTGRALFSLAREHGHKDILFVHADSEKGRRLHYDKNGTWGTVQDLLHQAGIVRPYDETLCHLNELSGRLAERKERPVSLIYCKNNLASRVVKVLHENGLTVPGDISVVVYEPCSGFIFGTESTAVITSHTAEERILEEWLWHKAVNGETGQTEPFRRTVDCVAVPGATCRKIGKKF